MITERAAWYSMIAIIFALLAMGTYKLVSDSQCKQTAVSQNYPAEAIKKICR